MNASPPAKKIKNSRRCGSDQQGRSGKSPREEQGTVRPSRQTREEIQRHIASPKPKAAGGGALIDAAIAAAAERSRKLCLCGLVRRAGQLAAGCSHRSTIRAPNLPRPVDVRQSASPLIAARGP